MKRSIEILAIIALMLLPIFAYAGNSKIELRGTVDNDSEIVQSTGAITKYFSNGATQQQTISLDSSSYTNISIPSGAKGIIIDVMSSDGIKLKGVTGDVGISLDSTMPVMFPVSGDGSTTIGLQNLEANSNRVKVYFF